MPKQTHYQNGSNNNNNNNSNNGLYNQLNNNLRYQGPQSALSSSSTNNALHFLQQQFQPNNPNPTLYSMMDGSSSTMGSDEIAQYYSRLFSSNNNNSNNNNNMLNRLNNNSSTTTPTSTSSNSFQSVNSTSPNTSTPSSSHTNPSAILSPLPPVATPLADSLSFYLEQLGLPNQRQTGTNNKGLAPNSLAQLSSSSSSDKIASMLNNINVNIPMTSPTSSSSLSSSGGSNGNQHNNTNNEEGTTKKKKKKKPTQDSDDEDMQVNEDENSALFHPIACVQCRRLHKRCDRKLPSCSKCVSRGVNCEYKIPRKKGRTAKAKSTLENETTLINHNIIQDKTPPLIPSEAVMVNTQHEQDKNSTTTAPEVDIRKISEMNLCIFDTTPGTCNTKPLHSSTTKLLANILSETPYGQMAKSQEKHLDKRKVLDLYYNIFGNGMPVIDRKEFEGYLAARISSNNSRDEDEEMNTDSTEIMPNKKEVYAMFLAIKALCEQRTGFIDLAEESMKKAREALSKFFDEHSNFYVCCCYAFMSIYESGCGRLKTAKYYLQSVNFYLDELTEEEQQHMTVYQKNLKKIRSFCKVCSSNDHGVLALLKDWPAVFEKTLGIQVPTEWKQLLEQDLSANNYSTIIKVIETLLHIVRMHLTKTGTERNLKIFDMGATIVFHGIRLGILSAVNRGKELIEESALKVTFATENELFLFAPPPIVAHVAAAAKVHLHIVKSIEAGERQNPEVMMVPTINYGEEPRVGTVDYYEILAKDLRALNILAKRYKKVSLFHKNLMQEMEEIINRKHLMSALNLFTTHSLNESNTNAQPMIPPFTQNFSSGNGSQQQQHTQPQENITSSFQNNTSTMDTNDLFNHYLSEFSEFQNVKNTKEFFTSLLANPNNNNTSNTGKLNLGLNTNNTNPTNPTLSEAQNINWQDMLNNSFTTSSPVPNSHILGNHPINSENSSLQNESFFEPFLDTDDMQEIYSFAYDEAIAPFLNNND